MKYRSNYNKFGIFIFLLQAGYSVEPHPVAESDSFKMEICASLGLGFFMFPQGELWLGVYLSPLFKIVAGGSFLIEEDRVFILTFGGIAREIFVSPRVSIEPRACVNYLFIITKIGEENKFGGLIQLGYNYYASKYFKISPFTRVLTSVPYFAIGCEFSFTIPFG